VVTGPTDPVATASSVATAAAGACVACGEPLVDGARFCEACGAAAGTARPAAAVPGGVAAVGAAADAAAEAAATACTRCGGEVDADGYCTSCGHRAIEDVAVDDRGRLAAATHRGRRHPRNEDAAALAATSEGWPVLVVSDGVSISPNPHRASAAAVAAVADRLGGRPFGGGDDLADAVAVAHAAASAVPGDDDPHWTPDGSHPACTLVVAVVTDSALHTANVGDARAHLLTPAGDRWAAAQVSTDDSVAAQAVAQGIDAEVALNLPGGHGIVAWLGADAPEPDPHVAAHPAGPDDLVLVCSDGLWNYAPTDDAMGELVTSLLPPPGRPAEPLAPVCEQLVSWAVDQGGADNITVALTSPPAAPGGADPTELEDNA
jgi:serine/threonine protein phosphatase PrpC